MNRHLNPINQNIPFYKSGLSFFFRFSVKIGSLRRIQKRITMTLQDELQAHINDPGQLEKMYRSNKTQFKKEFNLIYPSLQGNLIADTWHERLNFEKEEIVSGGNKRELQFILIIAVLAGFIAKLPAWFQLREDFFYPRNIGFIVLPFIAAYFAWKNNLSSKRMIVLALVLITSIAYINLLPDSSASDTLTLACIHLIIVLWVFMGSAFVGKNLGDMDRRLGFLKYNGDLIVICALILIAGGILSGLTVGLFSLIGIEIADFYFEYVAIFGLAATPIIGTYLTQSNPQLVGKVSPVIARIFSPLVLVMLVIYLVAIIYSGKDPYNDREFLMIFNTLLIGVMAIIFFSLAEGSNKAKSRPEIWVLSFLSLVTIIVNGIALSAILFRISAFGITPNRLSVMGGNVLILINLLLVTVQLFRVISKKTDISNVGKSIASYIPIYFIWVAIVTFLFPVLFGFR